MKKFEFQFFTLPPGEGGIKIEVIFKFVVEHKLQNMNFKTHKKRLNPEDELSISKFEQIIAISVSLG